MSETYRIMVVEDEPALAELLERFIRRRYPTMHVETYWSGRDAFDAYQEQGADLLLVDRGLPDMDGLVLTQTLRARGDTVPIIGMSGSPEMGDQYFTAGATAFVSGPTAIDQILALIQQLLLSDVDG